MSQELIDLLRLSEGRTTFIRDLTPITQVIGGNLLAIMKRLSQLDLIHWDQQEEKITVAYPFSGVPTSYRVAVSGKPFTYAMCALDALGIAPMMNADLEIETQCAMCGRSLHISIQNQQPVSTPTTVGVGIQVPSKSSDCCSLSAVCCPGTQFYCSHEHWEQNKPKDGGKWLELPEAFEVARYVLERPYKRILYSK
ncbi:MAG: organomercurial lyase [Firmicutes bacterium]|jgi:hypothetical protein|nr:organomercurial lyase [Bacillota bacterium]